MVLPIRRATPADAAAVAEVWLRSRQASIPAIPAPVHTDDEVRRWFAGTVLPEREVWVAGDGAVVGVLVLDGHELDQLYVDPERTGEGLGGQLVEHAKRERPGGLALWTFEANAGARRFYEAHGFTATGASAGANEEGAPDVRYEWRPAPGSDAG